MRLMLLLLMLLLAFPAHAQIRTPGKDFIPDPEWSEDFTQGMMALHERDLAAAETHFQACVDKAKVPDPNCEYYLALMFQSKGDMPNFRKWLNTAAAHGQPMAVTVVDVMERFK